MAALGAGLAAAWPATPALALDPEWSAVGSLLLPGVGQMINRDYAEGSGQIALSLVLSRQYTILIDKPDYLEPQKRVDSRNYFIDTNRTTFEADFYGTAFLDLSFYSAFAAYRDARRAQNNAGYVTPVPKEMLDDLALAPFSWDLLRRPTTFIPVAVALYFAVAPPSRTQYLYRPDSTIDRNTLRNGAFATSEMVAIGEESFFRGFLNNGLSSTLGPNWGLGLSSAAFGLAHGGVGAQATSLGATVFGLYLGLVQQRNDYDFREGVAIHFWWDFLVTLGMLQQRRDKTEELQLAHIELHF